MENTRKIETKSLTKMAILAALIFFGTYFVKIPGINGYTHFGDCMIFIAVLIVGTKKGALSAAVGASLADLLGGYAQWIIPTFFIKTIMATIMGLITEKVFPNLKFGWLIGAILGGIFQIIGYTLVRIPLYGLTFAIAEVPGIVFQTLSGIILSAIIISILSQANVIRKLKEM